MTTLKTRLKKHELTIGSWITLESPAIAEIMTNAGFDWIVVDKEHSVLTIGDAGNLIRTIELSGSVPLVRLTSNDDANQIKRVMDAGAHGIVVPMVNSVDDAISAIAATRYEPEGTRGVGLARAQKYGASFQSYLEWQKMEPIVIVQIEHISAIDNLETIFALDDVDGFIIGPYDLSCSMGIPGQFNNPKFLEVMSQIRDFGKKAGKVGGVHVVEPDKLALEQAIADGYLFIAYSVDIRMLDSVCRDGLKRIRG